MGSKLVAVRQVNQSGSTLSYIMQDHLGSTVGSVDTSGTTVSTISYAAFGGMRNATGTSPTDMKFTGQRLDNTGLYYYNARYYDPGIGRFISADTIVPNFTNPQSLNRYSYCRNNPLKYIDPTGHYNWWGEFCGVVNGTGNGEEGSGRGTDGNSAGPKLNSLQIMLYEWTNSNKNYYQGWGDGISNTYNAISVLWDWEKQDQFFDLVSFFKDHPEEIPDFIRDCSDAYTYQLSTDRGRAASDMEIIIGLTSVYLPTKMIGPNTLGRGSTIKLGYSRGALTAYERAIYGGPQKLDKLLRWETAPKIRKEKEH